MATAPEFRIKAGDRLPKLRLQLKDSAGVALNITGATPTLRARARGKATPLTTLTGSMAIIDQVTGVVEYSWGAAEPLPAGVYDLEVPLNYSGSVQTVPTSGYITLIVEPAIT